MFSPKVLILGAGEGQIPLITRAKKSGWYTVVASPMGNYPGLVLADECLYVDVSDVKKVLAYAKTYQVQAIASDQTDISIATVQYVAEKLNLPHIQCEDINNFRYKSLMRKVCMASGIPTIPYCETSSIDDAKQFYESLVNHKAIIKPIDSQGSRGVNIVESLVELECAFIIAKQYSKSGTIIIEQFIEGTEIEVDSVVYDGEVVATLVGDVHNFESENVFSAYERIYPTQKYADRIHEIELINYATIEALGLKKGWTHGEYIVSNNGQVFLLEVGARGGGNYIGSHIVGTMLGVGTDEMAFATAIGDESFYKNVALQPLVCAYKCFYLPQGDVVSMDVDWQYLKNSFIAHHNLSSLHIGKRIGRNSDKTSRYTIVAKAESFLELRRILDEIPIHINIHVKTDTEILPIIWR